MGTFAETAIVDYRFLFANQGKQASVFLFSYAANNWKFVISIFLFSKQTEVAVFHSPVFCISMLKRQHIYTQYTWMNVTACMKIQ